MLWQARQGFIAGRGALDAAPSSPPTFTFVSTVVPTGAGTSTISTAAANIGTADANRRVYIIMAGGLGSRTLTNGSSTINGVTVTEGGKSTQLNNNNSFYWASAVVPSGTTGVTVSLVFSAAQFGAPVFGIYTVDNTTLISPTPTLGVGDISAGATTGSAVVATTASGSIISAITTSSGTSAQTISTSDASLSVDASNINAVAGFGHANATPASASSNVTWTWTTSSTAGICNFAFR
jgi:hypothetical protein